MKVYVFDLDGTLAKSKSPIDGQMKKTLEMLLNTNYVCVVSGGGWPQFEKQLISYLPDHPLKKSRLHCFPTCGTTYYTYDEAKWHQVYNHKLSGNEKAEIYSAFQLGMQIVKYEPPEEDWGDIIEDRGSQITFSALGQQAPHEAKKVWDPDRKIRQRMIEAMAPMLPDFDVRLGGTTSVDVTRKGHDKRLAIDMILKYLKVRIEDLVFFGDALEPGGNDHPVYERGVLSIPVKNHIDCVWKIRQIYSQL